MSAPRAATTLPPVVLLRVTFRVLTDGLLPALPTTALHGALARALWREVCVAPARPTCRGCPVEHTCAYPRLFDPAALAVGGVRELGVTGEVPRALWIAPEPPLVPTGDRPFPVEGAQEIAFRIGLAEFALDTLPALRRALRRVARRGFGPPGRALQMDLLAVAPLNGAALGAPLPEVCVEFFTPVRLKHAGKIEAEPDAELLVQSLVRRARLLAAAGAAAWRPPFDVATVANSLGLRRDLRVVDVSRYSARQHARLTWPGLIGTIHLDGPGLADLWPLLRWGEGAQIGKATTFGFGRYVLRCP